MSIKNNNRLKNSVKFKQQTQLFSELIQNPINLHWKKISEYVFLIARSALIFTISMGIALVSSFYFCSADPQNPLCLNPTAEIIFSASIGIITTALFFYFVESRTKEIKESQNIGFMNIVYPLYAITYQLGWHLSMMYYAGKPRDEWNKILETCEHFQIPIDKKKYEDESEFKLFLDNGCRAVFLLGDASLFSKLNLEPSLTLDEKLNKLKDYQLRIHHEIKNYEMN